MKHQPYLHVFIIILAIGGLLSGIVAWLFLPDMLVAELRSYVWNQMDDIGASLTFSESFKAIFCANTMDLLRIYLFGMCFIGLPIVTIFLYLKCFSIGFAFCLLFQSSILLCFTRILYIPILCIATIIGCRFTIQLIQAQQDGPIRRLLQYSLVFVGLIFCTFLISALDGLSTYYSMLP